MKKGQLGNLTGLAWGIVFLGVILIVGTLVVSGFQASTAINGTLVMAGPVTGWNLTGINTTSGAAVANVTEKINISIVDTSWNSIAGGVVNVNLTYNSTGALNYTLYMNGVYQGLLNGYNTTNNNISIHSANLVNNSNTLTWQLYRDTNITAVGLAVTYWDISQPANTNANTSATQVLAGLGQFGTYIGLIVTIGVMAVIIGIVLLAFGGMGETQVGRRE